MIKIIIAVFIAASLISCAGLGPKPHEAKEPAVTVKIHNCNMCHQPHKREGRPLLNKPLSELCVSCHPQRKGSGEHIVGIKPTIDVGGLPLDAEGKLTCVTCHDPHEKEGFPTILRAPGFNEICKKCHKGY